MRSVDVVLLTNEFRGGGAERAANLLAEGLVQLGLRVCLVPLRSHPGDVPELPYGVLPLAKPHGSGVVGQLRVLPSFLSAMAELRPAVVHAHCEGPEAMAAVLPRTLGRRIVVTEHQLQAWGHRSTAVGRLVRRRLAARDATWIVPRQEMNVRFHGHADHVIPNPLPPAASLELGTGAAAGRRIVVVSQLIPSKRVDWVVRAAAMVRPVPSLLLIGTGPEEPRLRELARSLGVVVEFTGFLTAPWRRVSASDIFASASETESDGLAVAEAVVLGLDVVASDLPAHRALGLKTSQMFSTAEALGRHIQHWVDAGELTSPSLRAAHAATLQRQRDVASIAAAHAEVYGISGGTRSRVGSGSDAEKAGA